MSFRYLPTTQRRHSPTLTTSTTIYRTAFESVVAIAMEELGDVGSSYSPSQWAAHNPVGCDYDSPLDSFLHADTPVALTPSQVISVPATPVPAVDAPRPRKRRQVSRDKLPLVQLGEWDPDRSYDEDPSTCVHYSLEWKVVLNGKQISKDTERNLVLAPRSFWPTSLRPRLDQLVRKKVSDPQSLTADETTVIVSVTGRSQKPLTKRFDALDIDWTFVETHLVEWSVLFQGEKQLWVDITFHSVSSEEGTTGAGLTKRLTRGRTSTTQRMLQERNARLQADEESGGIASVWTDVCRKVRCPTACVLGPHCWPDQQHGVHRKLYTHHLRALVKHVQEGGTFDSAADMPDSVRDELRREADDAAARKRPTRAGSPRGSTPITINNHFPEQSLAKNGASSSMRSPVVVSGCHDLAVREYSVWLQSRFHDPVYKDHVATAMQHVLSRGLCLDQLHEDGDAKFLIEQGVMDGVARRFISDIKPWVKSSTTS